mgnify:CR=1 FL=1
MWAFPSLLKLECIAVKYPKAKIVLVNQRAENDPDKIHKIDFFAGGKDYLGPIVEYRDIYRNWKKVTGLQENWMHSFWIRKR